MAHGLAVTALRTAPSLRTTGQPISRHPSPAQGIDRDANRGDGWSEATWDCGELPVGSPQLFSMLVPFIVRALAHSGGWVAPAGNPKRPHDGPPRASAERSTRSRRRTKGTEGPSRAPAGDAETADLPGAEWAGRCANTGARPASCRSHSCADGRSSGWRLREVVGRVARSRNRGVPLPAATPRRASTARHHAWQWLHQASGWRGATALNGLDVARRGPCSRQAAIWSRKPMGHRAQ
ncbi:MAG: hypothetical protein RIR65_1596 [Planctomycetota bacterium]